MPKSTATEGPCQLCQRLLPLTFHHLIPKVASKNKWFRKNHEREAFDEGIMICRTCHSFLHKKFTEKELGRNLNTLEKLLDHEMIVRYIGWAKKQK